MTQPARRALAWIHAQRWYMQPEWVEQMRTIAARTHEPDFEAVLAKRGQRPGDSENLEIRGAVAILSVDGPIFRYANVFTQISGAVSIESLAKDLRAAVDNPAVGAIILNVDSPGGQVNGTAEFADMVRAARQRKPVVAYVSGLGASAAYWIASAAGHVYANQTAMLGSIGVAVGIQIDDDDKFVEMVSTQSPNKRPDVRTDEGRALIQAELDALAEVFVRNVASNRGVSAEKVLTDFGRGGILVGQAAVTAGLADDLASLETLISQFQRSQTRSPGAIELGVDVDARREWAASAELRHEFGEIETYLAWRRRASSG